MVFSNIEPFFHFVLCVFKYFAGINLLILEFLLKSDIASDSPFHADSYLLGVEFTK